MSFGGQNEAHDLGSFGFDPYVRCMRGGLVGVGVCEKYKKTHPGNLTAKASENRPVNQEGKRKFHLPNIIFQGLLLLNFRGCKG